MYFHLDSIVQLISILDRIVLSFQCGGATNFINKIGTTRVCLESIDSIRPAIVDFDLSNLS